jgi:hypothetical protein
MDISKRLEIRLGAYARAHSVISIPNNTPARTCDVRPWVPTSARSDMAMSICRYSDNHAAFSVGSQQPLGVMRAKIRSYGLSKGTYGKPLIIAFIQYTTLYAYLIFWQRNRSLELGRRNPSISRSSLVWFCNNVAVCARSRISYK